MVLSSCNSFQKRSSDTCSVQEVKYLSTYIDSRMWDVAGGNEKIDSMFFQDISGMSNDEIESLSFIVPMLLNGIKNYNSDGLFDNEEKELIKETSMDCREFGKMRP